LGEVSEGGACPSEESLRRRWAFFSSLSGAVENGWDEAALDRIYSQPEPFESISAQDLKVSALSEKTQGVECASF